MKDEDEAEDIEFEDGMYDWPFCSIQADSHCFQLSVVHGITNRRDRDLRSIFWAKLIEEFQRTQVFEAYFDDTLGLVGLSFAPFGETRYFGRHGMSELAETPLKTEMVEMGENSTMLRRQTRLGNGNSHLRLISVEIGPDKDVTGVVLHMTGTNPSAYANIFNELERTSSAEAPPVMIRGLTVSSIPCSPIHLYFGPRV